jgi:hypothetical protein
MQLMRLHPTTCQKMNSLCVATSSLLLCTTHRYSQRSVQVYELRSNLNKYKIA